jgi:2-amino-4-hydroxy-6-hydroxymethyldihydropteridine diphosphokinase
VAEAGLAFGGNLGDAAATIGRALDLVEVRNLARVRAISSLWATPPWGLVDQPDFLNACAIVEPLLVPHALLHALQQIEADLGRRPTQRWGPREIDIDLLFYDDLVLKDSSLELPHPRMFERAFVLAPLDEIAASRSIAGHIVGEVLARSDRTGIRRLGPIHRNRNGSGTHG